MMILRDLLSLSLPPRLTDRLAAAAAVVVIPRHGHNAKRTNRRIDGSTTLHDRACHHLRRTLIYLRLSFLLPPSPLPLSPFPLPFLPPVARRRQLTLSSKGRNRGAFAHDSAKRGRPAKSGSSDFSWGVRNIFVAFTCPEEAYIMYT